jgi:glutathione S-transferase
MTSIELFLSQLCPFAHRARLVVAEKGLSSTEVDIDLRNKPTWFLDIAPRGEVPLLRHRGHCVWSAAAIAEYLEEVFPEYPLLPKTPAARAEARSWIDFADTSLYATTKAMLHSSDPRFRMQCALCLEDELRFIQHRVFGQGKRGGRYWFGAQLSLTDLAFYPWFEQVAVLERFCGFRWPPECHGLRNWVEVVAARDAVQAIATSAEVYVEAYGRLAASLAQAS